jgi:hypothetical protein
MTNDSNDEAQIANDKGRQKPHLAEARNQRVCRLELVIRH